jgi:hypothetical protein
LGALHDDAGGGGGGQYVEVAVTVDVTVASTGGSVTVVRMVTTTVFGTDVVTTGLSVMVAVWVVDFNGWVVIVFVLQPGVVSMHEQSVLTKEEACFWSEEKIGASLSVVFAVVVGLVRLTTVTVGAQLVIVVSVDTVMVVVIASGVL